MEPIYHLALPEAWEQAEEAGRYEQSTRGVTLAAAGFVHAATQQQWAGVRQRFYADVTEDLHLLQIDPEALTAPVLLEPGEPGGTELFPHIHGPVDLAAVQHVHTLHPPHDLPADTAAEVSRIAAVVAAEPGAVWDRLTDWGRSASWLPGVRAVTADGPVAAGTRVTYLTDAGADVAVVTDVRRGSVLRIGPAATGGPTRTFHLAPATSDGRAATVVTLLIEAGPTATSPVDAGSSRAIPQALRDSFG